MGHTKHTDLAGEADALQASRNALALKALAKERDDIGDDPETLRMIEESRAQAQQRTDDYHAAQESARKKAGAPGAASSAVSGKTVR